MKRSPNFNTVFQWLQADRPFLQRLFYSLTFLLLLGKYLSHLFIHQIGNEPILYQEIDPAYWLLMISNLPGIVVSKVPVVFDGLLVVSCVCSIIWNKQNISTTLFFILYFLFFLLSNALIGHHHINIAVLFISFPFVFKGKENFAFAFSFVRFLFCFSMFSAGIWKIVRGNLTYPDQIYTQLISRHLVDLLQHKTSLRLDMVRWLIQHRLVAHLLWVVMIALEVTFVLGFFTYTLDWLLTICYLLFAIGGWLVLDFIILENVLFLLTLRPAIRLVHTVHTYFNGQPGKHTAHRAFSA